MQIIQQGIILANALRRRNSQIEVVMWYNIKILFGWSCYGLCFIRDDWYIMRWEPTKFMSASIRTEATAEYGLTAKKAVLDFINLTFYWWPFLFQKTLKAFRHPVCFPYYLHVNMNDFWINICFGKLIVRTTFN